MFSNYSNFSAFYIYLILFFSVQFLFQLAENRAGPSSMGMGNVISQILMCKELKPGLDFQNQELGSISKDSQEIAKLLSEVQEFLPHQEKNLETSNLLNEDKGPWPPKRRKGMLYKNMGLLCCISRPPNYI